MARTAVQRQKRVTHPLMKLFKRIREDLGWSQQDVADQIEGAGTQSMLSDLESGVTRFPRLETVARVFRAVGHVMEVRILDPSGAVVYVWFGEGEPQAVESQPLEAHDDQQRDSPYPGSAAA